ncbi:MAG: beta-ketoacyl synthase chain length factor, partial [Rubrivivax sp.]|nr:beta-ketoacyl synthase chain length factor [Rubrivivax sp.]
MTIHLSVLGIGVLGPGLADWAAALPLLQDPSRWVHAATVVPPPNRLPPTERRRAGAVVKASIVVADQALANSVLDATTLPTVFTSSTGDPANCHLLCEALAAPERLVSPTRFTNSVHNAPAGYWHIAAHSQAPSTSLAAFDASFAAGLVEAAVQCVSTGAPVLLVACDVPYPEPLHAVRPVADVFALALVLAPAGGGRQLQVDATPDVAATACTSAAL